jgi:serine/threonine protein kinase
MHCIAEGTCMHCIPEGTCMHGLGRPLAPSINSAANPELFHTPLKALQVAQQTITAMRYLHSKCKIIHRDLKSNNIFIEQTDATTSRVQIGDFGLALLKGKQSPSSKGDEGWGLGFEHDVVLERGMLLGLNTMLYSIEGCYWVSRLCSS